MGLYTVIGCVTDIEGATLYMCHPSTDRQKAVSAWYIMACENNGINPEENCVSAEHERLLDTAHALRTKGEAFIDGETLAVHSFEVEEKD